MNTHRVIRMIVICILILAIATAVCLLFFTHRGQEIMKDPRLVGPRLSEWIISHPIRSMLTFFALYILLPLLLLPVWPLQVIGGYVLSHHWGLFWGVTVGVVLCQTAATISALTTFLFSRWLAADWFHEKVEAKMEKLRRLDENLGHNGFLLVMATRLMHLMPFALTNYMLGVLTITVADIVLGTFLGSIPGVLLYVALGAHPQMVRDWRFSTAMVVINVVLIIPIAMRYFWPRWFKKIGVE